MSEVVKAEGLVIALNDYNGVYPIACAKTSTLTISQDMIELAPKTSSAWREFIPSRKTYTLSGDGLLKIQDDNNYGVGSDFENKIITNSNIVYSYFFLADNNEGIFYELAGYLTELSYSATVGGFAQYNFTIQGSGNMTSLFVDQSSVDGSGIMTGVDPTNYQFIALQIDGKMYFNFTPDPVTGDIDVGLGFAGKEGAVYYKDL